MPEWIVATDLPLAVDHILWGWIVLIDQFRGQVKEHGASVPRHLLYSEKINGYPRNGQRLSVTYTVGIVNVNLHGAFDRASPHKYAGG